METVIAVLIVGAALTTVLSMITTSVRQVNQQKMQTAAINFSSGQMNRILFEERFENVLSHDYKEMLVDGVWFQYKLEVVEIPNSEIRFKFKHVQYHDPRHGSTATGAEPSVPAGITEETRPITELDAKFTSGGPVLKDFKLTVRWHGAGEEYKDDFSLSLISRKARI